MYVGTCVCICGYMGVWVCGYGCVGMVIAMVIVRVAVVVNRIVK